MNWKNSQGLKCPHCNSENYVYEGYDIDENIKDKWVCYDCGVEE